jgi:hypothetical protein
MKDRSVMTMRTACGILLTVSLACLPGSAALPAASVSTNAADLYREAYSTMTNGPAIPWDAMASNTLDEAGSQALGERLRPVLNRIEQAAELPFCDWQLDYSQGPAMLMPHLSPVRQLCKATLWAAVHQPGESSRNTTDLFVMELQMARRLADDPMLISQLCATAAESMYLDAVAKSLKDLAPQDLARLAAATPNPGAGDQWQMAMLSESEGFVGWLIRKIMDAARSNGLDRAGSPDAAEAARGGTNTLVRDIRLCALLDVPGSPLRIGLELKDANNIWLSAGQTKQGITLVSADFERSEAVITRGNESATIHLESGEIVPYEMHLSPAQIKQFFSLMGLDSPATGEEAKPGRLSVTATHSILSELDTIQGIQTEWSKWRGWIPHDELERREKEAMGKVSDFGKAILPSVANAYETFFAARVRNQMLLAAIRQRQGYANALTITPDPTDGKPFEVRLREDGGRELVSRATHRGQPVTLRIGPQL